MNLSTTRRVSFRPLWYYFSFFSFLRRRRLKSYCWKFRYGWNNNLRENAETRSGDIYRSEYQCHYSNNNMKRYIFIIYKRKYIVTRVLFAPTILYFTHLSRHHSVAHTPRARERLFIFFRIFFFLTPRKFEYNTFSFGTSNRYTHVCAYTQRIVIICYTRACCGARYELTRLFEWKRIHLNNSHTGVWCEKSSYVFQMPRESFSY